jgi:hypothetical protein
MLFTFGIVGQCPVNMNIITPKIWATGNNCECLENCSVILVKVD